MTREKRIIMTSGVGIGGNIVLVATKLFVGLITASISIILDAVNNLTDALSSIITIIGTKLSNKKPDRKHPFGYGRIEYLTSMVIAFLILFAGATAVYESLQSIIDYWKNHYPSGTLPSSFSIVTLILVGVAILIKVGIGVFFRIQGKKASSDALKASSDDALWDSVLSLGTLIGAILAYAAHIYVEGYLGILIGAFIIKAGMGTLLESLSHIIGERMDDTLAHQMKSDVCTVPGVKGAYDLVINSYGVDKSMGTIHVEVEDHLKATEIQVIERAIQALMMEKYGIIFTVGIYAQNDSTPRLRKMKEELREIIKDYPTILQFHGFYVDDENKLIIFDLVMSFDEPDVERVRDEVSSRYKELYPEFKMAINLDQDIAG